MIYIAAAIGLFTGFISNHIYFTAHTFFALIPWGVIGLAIGYFTKTKKDMLWSGATYGALLTMSFLTFGFSGRGVTLGFIALLLIVGMIGAGCSIVLSLVGKKLRRT